MDHGSMWNEKLLAERHVKKVRCMKNFTGSLRHAYSIQRGVREALSNLFNIITVLALLSIFANISIYIQCLSFERRVVVAHLPNGWRLSLKQLKRCIGAKDSRFVMDDQHGEECI